jgi:hypothetical protein
MSFNNPFNQQANFESAISPSPDALNGLVPQIVLVSRLNSILQLRFSEIKLIISHYFYVKSPLIAYLLSNITKIRRLDTQQKVSFNNRLFLIGTPSC